MASLLYGLAYRLGLKPWDTGVTPPELVALVKGEGSLSPSGTLDLGCGTGTNVVYLCRQGWETTGVDLVARALAIARRKAAPAGVEPRLLQGDVMRLGDLDIGEGYSLLLDSADAYAKGVTAPCGWWRLGRWTARRSIARSWRWSSATIRSWRSRFESLTAWGQARFSRSW